MLGEVFSVKGLDTTYPATGFAEGVEYFAGKRMQVAQVDDGLR